MNKKIIGLIVLTFSLITVYSAYSNLSEYYMITSTGTIKSDSEIIIAKSGYWRDIQDAVDIASPGDTVYIPEGVWDFVKVGESWTGSRVIIPDGIKLRGAPTERTSDLIEPEIGQSNNNQVIEWRTVLRLPWDVPGSWYNNQAPPPEGSAPNLLYWFKFSGDNTPNGVSSFSDIKMVGYRSVDPSSVMIVKGIAFYGITNFRLDHCYFENIPEVVAVGGQYPSGLVDHCYFINEVGQVTSNLATCTVGYAIAISRAPGLWDDVASNILGQNTDYTVFVEDCYFEKFRHVTAGSNGAHYVLRHSTINNDYGFGSVDSHGGGTTQCTNPLHGTVSNPSAVFDTEIGKWVCGETVGESGEICGEILDGDVYKFVWESTRATEIYNCKIINAVELSDASFIRGGAGVAFNNIVGNGTYHSFLYLLNDGGNRDEISKVHINDWYIWDNTLLGNTILLKKYDPYNKIIENQNYFLRAPSINLDGWEYEPYIYPHPYVEETLENWITFDDMDEFGSWHKSSTGDIITINDYDYVQGIGCLKFTWVGWGQSFYQRPPGFAWDMSETPLLRFRIKANNSLSSAAQFQIVTDRTTYGGESWSVASWSLDSRVNSINNWITFEIDLRTPDSGDRPNLNLVKQISFSSFDYHPISTSINVDMIELSPGPTLPLETEINPENGYGMIGGYTDSYTIQGYFGNPPYTYKWYVNGILQSETSDTLKYNPRSIGKYSIEGYVYDSLLDSKSSIATLNVLEPLDTSPASIDTHKSEVRGALMHMPFGSGTPSDWDAVADTFIDYGLNTVVIETYPIHFWNRNTNTIKDFPELRNIINTFHERGINVHILLTMGLYPPYNAGVVQAATMTYNGDSICWNNPLSITMINQVCDTLSENYDIEGFMFDYTRWSSQDECYCEYCQTKFALDTGITDAVFPDDLLSGGKYYWDFKQWRLSPVTDTVERVRGIILGNNPDIIISAATFTAFQDCGNYHVDYIGQHTADWVDKNLLDFNSPMIYMHKVTGTDSVEESTIDSLNYYTGGNSTISGKIPTYVFYTTGVPGSYFGGQKTVQEFVDGTQVMMEQGANGWIIWRYGGPGVTQFIDIRPYLLALSDAGLMDPVWAIQNVVINKSATTVTISWTTTVPTNSSIEYGTQIFLGLERSGDWGKPLVYKDIEYTGGYMLENPTEKTLHSFTIPISDNIRILSERTDGSRVVVNVDLQ